MLKLRGVSFKWKSEAKMGKGRYYGMVAQEVKKVTPELVGGAPDGMLSVRYTDMVGLLVEAIKEQQSKMEAMEKRIKKLEAKKAK